MEYRLSKVLSNFHKFILENNYTKNYHDSDLVALEFMGVDFEEQVIKDTLCEDRKSYYVLNEKYYHKKSCKEIMGRELELLKELIKGDSLGN